MGPEVGHIVSPSSTRRRACAERVDADLRAREVEAQMTDDERFSLLVRPDRTSDLWPGCE